MSTIVIYDNLGHIISEITTLNVEQNIPNGIPYLIVEVPNGKQIESVNVSKTPHSVVYSDIQKTQTDILEERILLLESAMNELLLGGI